MKGYMFAQYNEKKRKKVKRLTLRNGTKNRTLGSLITIRDFDYLNYLIIFTTLITLLPLSFIWRLIPKNIVSIRQFNAKFNKFKMQYNPKVMVITVVKEVNAYRGINEI